MPCRYDPSNNPLSTEARSPPVKAVALQWRARGAPLRLVIGVVVVRAVVASMTSFGVQICSIEH